MMKEQYVHHLPDDVCDDDLTAPCQYLYARRFSHFAGPVATCASYELFKLFFHRFTCVCERPRQAHVKRGEGGVPRLTEDDLRAFVLMLERCGIRIGVEKEHAVKSTGSKVELK